MQLGRLNAALRIEAPPTGRDAAGQPLEGTDAPWSTVIRVRGDIRHLSGLETIRAGAEQGETKASIRMPFVPQLTLSMRIIDEETDALYEVTNVMHDRKWRLYTDAVCITRGGVDDE